MRRRRWAPLTMAVVALLVPPLAQAQGLPPAPRAQADDSLPPPPLPPPDSPPPEVPAELQPPPTPPPEPPAAPMVPAPFAPSEPSASTPAPPPVAAPPPGPEPFRSGFHLNGGLGLAVLVGDGARLGLGLEGVGEFRFTEHFGVLTRLGLGVAHFDRMLQAAGAGLGLIGGTAGAYAGLWGWMMVRDQWALLRLIGGFFAAAVLLLGFVVGFGLLVLSPLAAISYGEAALMPAVHLPLGEWDLFASGGLGLLVYSAATRAAGGWGPSIGLGLANKRFSLRLNLLWAPPGLTDRAGASAAAGMLTVGWGF